MKDDKGWLMVKNVEEEKTVRNKRRTIKCINVEKTTGRGSLEVKGLSQWCVVQSE